ncbi:MAG: hypothetical protein ACOZIN_14095 [Myxococcota bacterium]
MAAVLSSAPAPTPVDAGVKEIESLLANLHYTEAERATELRLLQPNLSRSELLRLLELQGVIAGTLSKPQKAVAAFRALLALAPDKEVTGYAPRITTPFFEAKAWLTSHPPLELSAVPAADQPSAIDEVVVEVKNDALQLARAVRFHLRAPGGEWVEQVHRLSAEGFARAPVAGLSEVEWFSELLGERHAVLLELGSAQSPLRAKAVVPRALSPELTTASPHERGSTSASVRLAGYGCAALATVTLGAGGWLGIRSNSTRADLRRRLDQTDASGVVTGISQKEAVEMRAQADGNAAAANILLAAGTALAATSGVLLWLDFRQGRASASVGLGGELP